MDVLGAVGFRGADRFRSDLTSLLERKDGYTKVLTLLKTIGGDIDNFRAPNKNSGRLMYSFDLENGQDASAAAASCVLDERIVGYRNQLDILEQDFYFNYFSHVTGALADLFCPERFTHLELRQSLGALIRVENCASLLVELPRLLYFEEAMYDENAVGRRKKALSLLQPIRARFSSISEADVYTLAGCVALEEMNGPRVAWRSGRVDINEVETIWRGGAFSENEKIVLKWLETPTSPFSNRVFKEELDRTNEYVELYANDEYRFMQDFTYAYTKLQEYRFEFAVKKTMVDVPQQQQPPVVEGECFGIFKFHAALELGDTDAWMKAVSLEGDGIMETVRNLTLGKDNKVNLDVFRMPHPRTPPDFLFDISNLEDRQAAVIAAEVDPRMTKFKPLLVPRIAEGEFYQNYFSHVYQIRKSYGKESEQEATTVYIGSTNPVKINACRQGFLLAFNKTRRFRFKGVSAPSGVADQPMGDEETRLGALNRAKYCQAQHPGKGDFYVGLEGGLCDDGSVMECFAWIAVIGPNDVSNCTRTATFNIPPALASLVRKGLELGRADDIVHGKTNSKQKAGTVGTLTSGVVDRTGYYSHAIILACAPFANPSLHI